MAYESKDSVEFLDDTNGNAPVFIQNERRGVWQRHPRLERFLAATVLVVGAGAVGHSIASADKDQQIAGLRNDLAAVKKLYQDDLDRRYNQGASFGAATLKAARLGVEIEHTILPNHGVAIMGFWQGTMEWNSGKGWIPLVKDPIRLTPDDLMEPVPRHDRTNPSYFGVFTTGQHGEFEITTVPFGDDYRFVPDVQIPYSPLQTHQIEVTALGAPTHGPIREFGLVAVTPTLQFEHGPRGNVITPGRPIT